MSLHRAYASAPYRVLAPHALSLRIGRRSHEADALLGRCRTRAACLVTAANPGRRRFSPARNAARMAALAARLRRARTLPAISGEGRWAEPQLLVVLPRRVAVRLARAFQQTALVLLRRGRPPSLVFLR